MPVAAVPHVQFTPHLRQWATGVAPDQIIDASGATVAAALHDVFSRFPVLRAYILDDQGQLRPHIAVFVDGVHLRRDILTQAVRADSTIYVLQALSGG